MRDKLIMNYINGASDNIHSMRSSKMNTIDAEKGRQKKKKLLGITSHANKIMWLINIFYKSEIRAIKN